MTDMRCYTIGELEKLEGLREKFTKSTEYGRLLFFIPLLRSLLHFVATTIPNFLFGCSITITGGLLVGILVLFVPWIRKWVAKGLVWFGLWFTSFCLRTAEAQFHPQDEDFVIDTQSAQPRRKTSGGIARVCNLPANIRQKNLSDLFGQYPLSKVTLFYDENRRSLGTAELHGSSSAIQRVAREFQNIRHNGQTMETLGIELHTGVDSVITASAMQQ